MRNETENAMRRILNKWCGKPWLIAVYAVGLALAVTAAVRWNVWGTPKRILCLLAILLPLHVFEENTFPDGFHYMMNLAQNSDRPDLGPMNRLTDMVSNFGGEVLFLLLFLWGGNVGTSILAAFFGIGESIVHTILGAATHKKLKSRGMKTIYGPGLATSYLALLPLSVYAPPVADFPDYHARRRCNRRIAGGGRDRAADKDPYYGVGKIPAGICVHVERIFQEI
jgi:hypothetical protein